MEIVDIETRVDQTTGENRVHDQVRGLFKVEGVEKQDILPCEIWLGRNAAWSRDLDQDEKQQEPEGHPSDDPAERQVRSLNMLRQSAQVYD
jgi:homospermidine synthase